MAPVMRRPDIVCLSHLRWNFVFQRPHHLMTRAAREARVYFVEEALPDEAGGPARLEVCTDRGVTIVVPRVPAGSGGAPGTVRAMLDDLLARDGVSDFILWYYTPMAMGFTSHLAPVVTVYDCMDELSAFAFAPPELKAYEAALLDRAAIVLTGGQSLYEVKRDLHPNVHAFPSSVDVAHFAQARRITAAPPDQAIIPRPRCGYFGVIDERMDVALLDGVAAARPDWHIVLVGPVVKIERASLPRRPNIHYLGPKPYEDLPQYVAGWDVALMPFARNAATRFISPTKTPEYLAAGRPVVSTSIRDVVRPYGRLALARIADDVEGFVAACDAAMQEDEAGRLRDADAFLRQTSWDGTWARMRRLVDDAVQARRRADDRPQAATSI